MKMLQQDGIHSSNKALVQEDASSRRCFSKSARQLSARQHSPQRKGPQKEDALAIRDPNKTTLQPKSAPQRRSFSKTALTPATSHSSEETLLHEE